MMEDVIEDALRKRAFDNITGIVIMLKDLKNLKKYKYEKNWEKCEEILFDKFAEC